VSKKGLRKILIEAASATNRDDEEILDDTISTIQLGEAPQKGG
jgi:hypothetical protein